MKRILAFLMCFACASMLFVGCAAKPNETITEETTLPANIMQKEDPSKDDTLNILMIGSSFCFYYVEELWGMLNEAGIKAKVCNVYYSGCPIKSHWEWWKSGEANYDFYVTDENGRVGTEKAGLEYCLKQANWDIISLQESTHQIRNNGAENHFNNTKGMLSDLWGYIKEQFPLSRYFWHQPWAYQVGSNKNGIQMKDLNMQLTHTIPLKEYAIRVCKEFDLEWVNSGEAWHIVRQGGYDELCARTGTPDNKGDYSHDGDIGGGQYLNACLWYEIITGESCIGHTWRPDYALDEALIPTLQNAAHQAAQQRSLEG